MQTRNNALAVAVVAVGVLLTACSVVVEVDGTAHDVRVYVPTRDAPPGSDTPTPTRTPTATATATPSATVTPRSSPTPAATDTPLYGTDAPPPDTLTPTPQPSVTPVFPTPTPDTLPSVTPGPSATPLPPPDSELCFVASNYNMRIRSGPGTQYPQVGLLPSETRAVVVSLWIQEPEGSAQREEWAQLGEGRWLAVWISGDQLAFLDDAAPCWELPRDGPGSVPQPRIGFKTVPGAQVSVLVEFANRLPDDVQAVAFTVQDTELATKLHNAGIYTVFVPWSAWPGDCANVSMTPRDSAADRVEYVARMAGGALFDAIVLSNECAFPSAAWYAEWALATLDLCDARGWRCIPTVWNTGAPDLDWIPDLDALHCAMQARGHFYGANVYPYWPVTLMSDDQRTLYTTWRHRFIQARMRCAPEWFVTELAPDGGGWSPDVADTAAYINATWGEFGAVGVWYMGNRLGAWPDAVWSAGEAWALADRVQ